MTNSRENEAIGFGMFFGITSTAILFLMGLMTYNECQACKKITQSRQQYIKFILSQDEALNAEITKNLSKEYTLTNREFQKIDEIFDLYLSNKTIYGMSK